MSRIITVAAPRTGPVGRLGTRGSAAPPMVVMPGEGSSRGAGLVVSLEPELTNFYPGWNLADEVELDRFHETRMPSPELLPLFRAARDPRVGFHPGRAGLTPARWRLESSILVDAAGAVIGKCRRVHLPGHADHLPSRRFQHLEKSCFEPGGLGLPVLDGFGGRLGMRIRNDRRWPETCRVMSPQGVEPTCLGHDTPAHCPAVPERDHLQCLRNHLAIQSGAYQIGSWPDRQLARTAAGWCARPDAGSRRG